MYQNRIKILYSLPSFSIGGIENQLIQQFSYFDSEKYDIHIATLFYYEGRPDFYNKLPNHIKKHIFNFRGYFDFKNYLALYKILKSVRPDIVVTSMFSANAVFRVFKLFFGYKIITREHNTYTDRTIFHMIGEKLLSPLSNEIIAVSRDVADFYCRQNWINRKKITVVNNGIDLIKIISFQQSGFDQDSFRQKIGIKPGEKVIINVARLKEQKNHKMLIDVFCQFNKEQTNYHLFILGDGQERSNLVEQISSLGLNDKVHLLGFRSDVFYFYAICEFFVLSSKIEGFPNVFLEAMSFGLPVISTSVPGANEIIKNGENGFIVRDNREMLEKMLELSQLNPQKLSLMKQSCQDTSKMFDVRNIVNKYKELFDKLLTQK